MNSGFVYTAYIWPMLLSAFTSVALAIYAWRRRVVPGATPFSIQSFFIGLWAFFTAIEISVVATSTKFLFHKLEAMSILVGVSAMLVCAMELASVSKEITRWATRLTSFFILCTFLLIWTNDFHHLVWTGVWFDSFLRIGRGPLNFFLMALVLLIPFLAVILFLRLFLKSNGFSRWQALLLVLGGLLPLLTFLLEPAGINPIAPADPVILVWTLSNMLYALAIFRFRMLEIVPIGRDSAIERVTSGILVLNMENRIVYLNPAARELLSLNRDTAGQLACQALASFPDLVCLIEQKSTASIDIALSRAGQPRFYQAQSSPLIHPGGYNLGWLILLTDVTEQRQAQTQLQEQQQKLVVLQERERIARELHDSLGQVFAFINAQGQTIQRLLTRGDLATAKGYLERLVEVAREADVDIRESILGLSTTLSTQGFFPTLTNYLAKYEKNYNIHVNFVRSVSAADIMFEPLVEVQLLRIMQEALTNVRKHACARSVMIEFKVEDSKACVTIKDDGQGFDPPSVNTEVSEHVGLRVMHERAEEVGGSLKLFPEPDKGTTVEIRLPIIAH